MNTGAESTSRIGACGHTPLQHATSRLTKMARQAEQDAEDSTSTEVSPKTARLTSVILNNIIDKVLVPALVEETALELGIDLVAIADSQIHKHAEQGVGAMAEFLKSKAL